MSSTGRISLRTSTTSSRSARTRSGRRCGQVVLGCKLVCEPSGAVSVAGFLEHHAVGGHGPAVAVVSGGNVDPRPAGRGCSAAGAGRPGRPDVKPFVLYTLARVVLFAASFGLVWLVFGHWIEWGAVSALYTAIIAMVVSSIVALLVLGLAARRLRRPGLGAGRPGEGGLRGTAGRRGREQEPGLPPEAGTETGNKPGAEAGRAGRPCPRPRSRWRIVRSLAPTAAECCRGLRSPGGGDDAADQQAERVDELGEPGVAQHGDQRRSGRTSPDHRERPDA